VVELRLCFLGESFVNGTGDPQCMGWASRSGGAIASERRD
jgi:hypothetical protein